MPNCGRCHTCGAEVRMVLDGEEYCPICEAYQRPRAHGWGGDDRSPCIEERIALTEKGREIAARLLLQSET